MRIFETWRSRSLGVGELEDLLLFLGLQPDGRRHEVAERAGVVDVRGRDLELLGQVRREADDPPEEALRIPHQRLELAALLLGVGHDGEARDEVGIVRDRLFELDPAQALDEDPQRPVGDADHLVDDRRRPDLVQVAPAGRLYLGIAHRDEGEQALAADHVVDEPDRSFLADRERRHRVGEDDGVLERQDRQLGRQLVDLRRRRVGEVDLAHRSGTSSFRIPASYVAVAESASTSSASSICRSKAPYSISTWR